MVVIIEKINIEFNCQEIIDYILQNRYGPL